MEQNFMSFVLSPIRVKVICSNCKKFIINAENTIIMSHGDIDYPTYSHIGEKIQPPCCWNKDHIEVYVPMSFPSNEEMISYVQYVSAKIRLESNAKVFAELALIKISDEIYESLRMSTPLDELKQEIYSERILESPNDFLTRISHSGKHLH